MGQRAQETSQSQKPLIHPLNNAKLKFIMSVQSTWGRQLPALCMLPQSLSVRMISVHADLEGRSCFPGVLLLVLHFLLFFCWVPWAWVVGFDGDVRLRLNVPRTLTLAISLYTCSNLKRIEDGTAPLTRIWVIFHILT